MKAIELGQRAGGKHFSLPMELVTQTVAILAKKGAGKSYTAAVMAEGLLDAGQQVIAIDPTGGWWGLRSSADGKSDGYPIVVLGGDHGDLPLEESAGETIARWIVERRFSAILDISLFRKGQARRFCTAFLETLYRINREPVHLFVDEADDIAPQKPFGDEAQMVGAMEDVVKRGRKKGIGCTLITQRPADLAKQVLTQCEMVVALRMSHPRDLAAVREWVNVHADPGEAAAMMASLPSLAVGDAWFWSPGWGDVFARVAVRRRKTFDSGATPKPGEKVREPKRLTPIDVAKLGEEIAAATEAVKANDPAALKKRIAALEGELRKAESRKPTIETQRVEIPVLKEGQIQRLEKAVESLHSAWNAMSGGVARAAMPIPVSSIKSLNNPQHKSRAEINEQARPARPNPAPISRSHENGRAPSEKSGQKRILVALAQHPQGLSDSSIGAMAGMKITGGSYGTYLSRLRTAGHIEGGADRRRITTAGMTALGDGWTPLPTGEALRDYWREKLGSGGARRIFDELCKDYPCWIDQVQLAERVEMARSGGSFGTYLSRLRALKLIEGSGQLRAAEVLFQ